MRHTLLFLLVLIAGSGSAQETATGYRWEIRSVFSADFMSNGHLPLPDDPFEEMVIHRSHRFSYTVGAVVGYRLTSRLTLETGMQHSRLNWNGFHNDPRIDWVELPDGSPLSIRYLEIPLTARVALYQGDWIELTLLGGLVGGRHMASPALFLDQRIGITQSNDLVTRSYRLAGEAGMGVTWYMGKRFLASFIPTIQSDLVSVSDLPDSRVRRLRLSTSVGYRL